MDSAAGFQEIGIFQQVPDPVRVFAQAEEIGFLLRVLDLPAAVGTLAVLELALGPEALAGLAVFALVGAFVNVAVVVHPAENLLDCGHVIAVSGANEAVVRDIHQFPQIQNTAGRGNDLVHKLLWGDAGLHGPVLDLLAVLISTGEEHDVAAGQSFIAGHSIGGHSAVGVADVELV